MYVYHVDSFIYGYRIDIETDNALEKVFSQEKGKKFNNKTNFETTSHLYKENKRNKDFPFKNLFETNEFFQQF